MKFSKLVIAAAILFIINNTAKSQKALDVNANIPIDKNVKIGKLENGLTYYIRKNNYPEKRIEFRLAVNAGSMQETEAQVGLAHFTEHMAFNGTKRFPKNELVSYLQSIGVQFGSNINAYTSFDETVYELHVPTDKEEIVDKGFQVMCDWAAYLMMDSKEIDNERGVIIEEYRMGLGADDRMRKKWFPTAFYKSLYADRLPIGTLENLKNFKHNTIREFYKDWYRPNLQAIIVVGDIDIDKAEAKIKQYFGELKNPENQKEKIIYNVEGNKEPLISIASDKEATNNMIIYFTKHKTSPTITINDFRDNLIIELVNSMMNSRLNELQQNPKCPFVGSQVSYGNFLARTLDAYLFYAIAKENQIDLSLKTIIQENEKIKKFGFLNTELDRAKEDLLSRYEKNSKEIDKTKSDKFSDQYVQHFFRNEPIPGAKSEFSYAKKLLDSITLYEVNLLPKKWLTDENQVVIITAPDKKGVIIPTEKQVIDILNDPKNKEVTPFVDNYKPEPLLKKELIGTKVIESSENSKLGTTTIKLGNGVTVVLKPTDFKNDEILFYAQSPGGNSLTEANDYPSAMFATSVIDRAGIADFDNSQLEKKLKGKNLSISPFIDDVKEGFTGNTTPKDLETLLQLTYLYFDSPRKDEKTFESFISENVNQLKLLGNNPMIAFYDTLLKTITQNDPRQVQIPNEDFILKANYDKIWSIYNDRFSNAGDFTFYFVGSFKVDEIIPLIEKYLGSLPNTGREENFKDVFNKFPSKTQNIKIKKGIDDKGMLALVFNNNYEWNFENNLKLTILEEILSIKSIELIREKLGGTYSPQIQLEFEKYPYSNFNLMFLVGCNPKNENKITKMIFDIIANIQKKGPTQIDLDKVKAQLLMKRESDLKTNKFWISKLSNSDFYLESADNFLIYNETVNAITIKDIQTIAKNLINTKLYIKTVLVPADKK